MTEPLTPEAIETLAAGYVVGNLDRTEVEVFEQLLAENPALVAQVKRLQATLDQVVYSLNSVEPPPHLQGAILAAATKTFPSSRYKRSRRLWYTIMGSVAALLILYLGVDNYRLRQDLAIAGDINILLQQSQTQLFSLKAVNASDTTTGSFIVNLGQRQGILAVQNLVAPPTGKVYRLWAIADGEKIPCGTVKINPQGKVLDKFWMPADFYDTGISGLFVTLESSETSRYPTGTIVMQSNSFTKS
ncbi:anti-sigma factor [Nostocaceae cyanobacterium CENA369]|uniref:Regulator of SigK n=1 Tax=Dendronalium phyllosphericum CENA369 TaxID=1725256 RepID=A0A8J7IHQ8_9NOST|nr:anti-sigma factor [Dendronalium phyllosphericum]MBH8578168.1 anti-sigma factor [Dendronalium phyllosphericum CENA369]